MKKRSLGVTMLAVWLVLGGLIGIYKGYVSSDPSLKVLPPVYLSLSLLFGVITIILGIGLFMLKEWARFGTICFQAVSTIFTVSTLPQMDHYIREMVKASDSRTSPELINTTVELMKGFSFFWSIIFLGIIVFFLTRPKVVGQFKEDGETDLPKASSG